MTKMERVLALRRHGVTFAEIAAAVGSTEGSCRVLYFRARGAQGTRRGRYMRRDSKAETIVRMRMDGVPYEIIAAAVGSTAVSCRTLFWQRRRLTAHLLASDPRVEWQEP